MRALLFFAVALLTLPAAHAQHGAATTLVSEWVASQERAAHGVRHVSCREESTRHIDSPRGAREIHTVARLRIPLGRPGVSRAIEHVTFNGREVPRDEQDRALRFLHHGRRDGSPETFLLSPALVMRLRPQGPPSPDPLVRESVRVDLRGSPEDGIEQLTLWFEVRSERLLRSRLLATHPGDAAPLVIETDYRRIRGLDLPEQRHVRGSMQIRKRTRSFTLLYEQAIAYHDYRFER